MIRIIIILEILGFFIAALMHFGLLIEDHVHEKARIAESIIALVLLTGLIITLIKPESLRRVSFFVQGFALLGTLIGIFTIFIGVGPQSTIDFIFHVIFIVLLITGLILTKTLKSLGGN